MRQVQHGKVEKIDMDAPPMVDLLVAGSPCQPFSGAGLGEVEAIMTTYLFRSSAHKVRTCPDKVQ